jgi:UDP-N-acetylglucosamine--N-acetylmuramyl-(pentapeptide) pyrophosphoryl-undecaprenol N-acetylglucosamine transferase
VGKRGILVRVVLTGGGTGGHIYPALSVARCLTGDDVLYVGTADGPEATIVPREGLEFRTIPSRKLSRRLSPTLLTAGAVCGFGVLRAALLLRRWRPDVVLGTGGYASAGVMFAAGLLRIPTVIHEANAVPGRTNRLLARAATRVALTYAASERFFSPEKCVVTGMPVRPDIRDADPEAARRAYGLNTGSPVLLVSGGSAGVETLNRAVLEALPQLGQLGLQVVHQTGPKNFDRVLERVGEAPAFYHPVPFIREMPEMLAAADLILARAGSSTLAEITAAGKPVITVPYPYAVADHQAHNARALAEAGAAIAVPDAELTGERLAAELRAFLQEPARLERMQAASRRLGRPEAAQAVADLLRQTAAGRLEVQRC